MFREPRIDDEDGPKLVRLFDGGKERRVVMESQSLAEPVNCANRHVGCLIENEDDRCSVRCPFLNHYQDKKREKIAKRHKTCQKRQ